MKKRDSEMAADAGEMARWRDGEVVAEPPAEASAPCAAAPQVVRGGLEKNELSGFGDLFVEDIITPNKIITATKAYRQEGKLQGLINLFDLFLDADDNLQSAVDVRKAALKRANWSYVGPELNKAKREWYDWLLGRYLGDWVDEYIEGRLKGLQFCQVIWHQEEGRWVPGRTLGYKNLDLRIVERELKLYGDRGKEIQLPDYKFIRVLYKRPMLLSVLRYYVFFAQSINHWAQFMETYGKPPRIGKYEPGTSKDEVEVLKSAVRAMGTDQSAVISKNTEIEFKDFAGKLGSQTLYEKLSNFVSDRVTKRILGQTLTTEEGDTGTYAQAKIHNMVRDDILDSDLAHLREYINIKLKWCEELNWGGGGVEIWLELPKPVDLDKRIAIDTRLLESGLPMSQDHFYDTYGIDRPVKGQALMPSWRGGEMARWRGGEAGASEVARWRDGEEEAAGAAWRAGEVASLRDGDSLAKLEREIRKLGSLKEIAEYNPRWFIGEWGRQLGRHAVEEYVKVREELQEKNAKAQSVVPKIRFEWNDESMETVGNLRRDAVIVSGVRTKSAIRQLSELAAEAVDAGLDFREFMRTAILGGFEPENPYHWRTEFETARVGGAASGRWSEITADKDILPYLMYVTMGDDLVREEHAALHGLVAAVDDPVWKEIYPPNGWNCRCGVEQLTAGEGEKAPGLGMKPGSIPDRGFGAGTRGGHLPGGAREKYGEYAEGEGGEMASERGGEMARWRDGKVIGKKLWWRILGGGTEIVTDVSGYPVQLDGYERARDTLEKADEVWQQLDTTTYLKEKEGKIRVVKVAEARVIEVREWSALEWQGQGREGFRER